MSDEYSKIREIEKRLHTKLFPKRDYVITRGNGALLYDHNGNEYIDSNDSSRTGG